VALLCCLAAGRGDCRGGARKVLDEYGFTQAENHLTEWHYLKYPFDLLHTKDPRGYPKVRQAFQEMAGPEGAAFSASVLMLLQDKAVDKVFYYAGDTDRYGLFDHFGVPHKTYYAFRAFHELMKTPNRTLCQGLPSDDSVSMCAGVSEDGKRAAFLVSNFRGGPRQTIVSVRHLPWTGPALVQVRAVDDKHDFDMVRQERLEAKEMSLNLDMPAPSVRYVLLSRRELLK